MRLCKRWKECAGLRDTESLAEAQWESGNAWRQLLQFIVRGNHLVQEISKFEQYLLVLAPFGSERTRIQNDYIQHQACKLPTIPIGLFLWTPRGCGYQYGQRYTHFCRSFRLSCRPVMKTTTNRMIIGQDRADHR